MLVRNLFTTTHKGHFKKNLDYILSFNNFYIYSKNLYVLYTLLYVLESLGCKFFISSCFRNPELNNLVGGVSNSRHLKGLACDVRFDSVQESDYFVKCLSQFGSLVRYHYFINSNVLTLHFDIQFRDTFKALEILRPYTTSFIDFTTFQKLISQLYENL